MATKKVVGKQKKKKWFQIYASGEFKNGLIGETLSSDGNDLIGRGVKINLMNVTGNPKNQSINVGFKINEVKDEGAYTELISYSLSSAHVRRMVRPAKSKIDDSFTCATKDNINVRIKSLFLTKKIVKSSILASLRHKNRELITKFINENDYPSVIGSLVDGKIQKDVRESLNKIYPLALYQVRSFERIK